MLRWLLLFLTFSALADPLEHFNTAGCVPYSLDETFCRTVPQWYLENTGEPSEVYQNGLVIPSYTEPGGTVDLNLPANRNARGVVVGVIDTGCEAGHEDMVDTIIGGCFISDRGTPVLIEGQYNDFDPDGHGTGLASIIAASHNGIGMAGIAEGVKLLIVSTSFSFPELSAGHAAKGIVWLTEHGANIIVFSWGETDQDDAALHAACNYALARNVMLVSAVGYGRNLNTSPTYPYSWDMPNYLAVSATTRRDELYPPSSTGARVVGAPGVRIVMASVGNTYVEDSGTSFASPMVGGIAAILWAQEATRRLPLSFQVSGGQLTLGWVSSAAEFKVYSTDDLLVDFSAWPLVTTVTNTSVTVPIGAGRRFFSVTAKPSAVELVRRIKVSAVGHPVPGLIGRIDAAAASAP